MFESFIGCDEGKKKIYAEDVGRRKSEPGPKKRDADSSGAEAQFLRPCTNVGPEGPTPGALTEIQITEKFKTRTLKGGGCGTRERDPGGPIP
jgi:hypothetical protein